MKKGLVLEGGSMRGLFTAGVLDVFMENGIEFDGAVGASAGAVFGCNLKSKQIGRVIRYNTRFCRDKRYASLESWLKTGDLFNAKFDYDTLPNELDIFDVETYKTNPMEFYVVATDAVTGKAVYHRCDNGDAKDLEWFRASASMPLAANIVEIDGRKLSDGGTADSIPLKFFEIMGYNRIVVIATQPKGFRKEKNKLLPVLRVALRKYPALIKALENRHIMYNKTLDYILGREIMGDILVIRPPEALNIGAVEHDESEMRRVYETGRAEAERRLEDLKRFLQI